MATNSNNARSRRRKKRGVPALLVIILLIIALLMGGLVGFAVARRTDPNLVALADAEDRIRELENRLTLIGYPLDGSIDPEQWALDANVPPNSVDDLSDEDISDDFDDLWSDDTLLDGMLSDAGEPVVVAEFDGGQLMSDEVIPEYNEQLTNYIFSGYTVEEISDSLLQDVLSYMVADKILAVRAQELGLDQLNDEDLAQIDREVAELYNSMLEDYAHELADEDMTDEQIRAEAINHLVSEDGISLATLTEDLTESMRQQKFYDYLVQDVTVSDEEIQSYYDEVLVEQRADFAEYPMMFEYTHNAGELVLYHPEGYRAVRDVLIAFDSAGATAAFDLLDRLESLDPATDAEALAQCQAELDALYAPLEATAQEALAKLSAGQSFASLMDEYGCEEELKEEPMRSQGFYISADSFWNSEECLEGSMVLDQPGQVSAPLRSALGIHLVEYIGDVAPGDVPLADVLDAVRADALARKQEAFYEEQRAGILAQANVKYYPERLQ